MIENSRGSVAAFPLFLFQIVFIFDRIGKLTRRENCGIIWVVYVMLSIFTVIEREGFCYVEL